MKKKKFSGLIEIKNNFKSNVCNLNKSLTKNFFDFIILYRMSLFKIYVSRK